MQNIPLIVATFFNLAASAAFIHFGRKFIMAQDGAIQQLNAVTTALTTATTQIGKIAAEEKGLQDQVAALQAAAGNGTSTISPELQAAIDGTTAAAAALSAVVQTTDDQVIDTAAGTDPSAGAPVAQ